MASARRRDLLILVLTLASSFAAVLAGDAADNRLSWVMAGREACRGTIADCLGGEEMELELVSEWWPRRLGTTNHISYDALKRDSVPCSRRGDSYYNCMPGGGTVANPYTRGCTAITLCRS